MRIDLSGVIRLDESAEILWKKSRPVDKTWIVVNSSSQSASTDELMMSECKIDSLTPDTGIVLSLFNCVFSRGARLVGCGVVKLLGCTISNGVRFERCEAVVMEGCAVGGQDRYSEVAIKDCGRVVMAECSVSGELMTKRCGDVALRYCGEGGLSKKGERRKLKPRLFS